MPGKREKLLEELGLAMREMSGLGVLHSAAIAARLGISSTDLECLDLVSNGHAATPGELAQRTGLTTGAITGVLDRLEAAGFIKRVRATDDRRKIYLEATKKVARLAEPLGEGMGRLVGAAIARYKNDELDVVLSYLRDVTEAAREAVALLRDSAERPRKQARKAKLARHLRAEGSAQSQ